jgi:hypothetical protein
MVGELARQNGEREQRVKLCSLSANVFNDCLQVDTLMRYLIDSAQREETSHRNALCPSMQQREEEGKGSKGNEAMDELRAELYTQINTTIKATITDAISSLAITHAPQSPAFTPAHHRSQYYSIPDHRSASPYYGTSESHSHSLPPGVVTYFPQPLSLQRPSAQPFPQPFVNRSNSTLPQMPEIVQANPPPPTAPSGLRIDDIDRRSKEGWLQAVQQWNIQAADGVPPLKLWNPEWYQGGMSRLFASKRSQRKLIAEEFARWVPFLLQARPILLTSHSQIQPR